MQTLLRTRKQADARLLQLDRVVCFINIGDGGRIPFEELLETSSS